MSSETTVSTTTPPPHPGLPTGVDALRAEVLPRTPRSPGYRLLRVLLWCEIVLLLALVQILFAGYSLGVGNQTIQIPFLKKTMNPSWYANDTMVNQTQPAYPTQFFRLMGKAMAGLEDIARQPRGQKLFDPITSSYFWLHVLTTGAVLATAYALGRAMFKHRASAVVLVLLLLAGHHRALGGDELYSTGFTHTWAIFPMAIGALALFYRGYHVLAFALAGVIFNFHALTAGYLVMMFLAWALLAFDRPQWLRMLGLGVGIFTLIALPTLIEMLLVKQQFLPQWFVRMRTRSADHSFPFSWWSDGNTEVPRFMLLMGLAALSFTFVTHRETRRKSIILISVCLVMFLLGTLFTEVWPSAAVVRAQFFRASRLLMVLALAHIAHGIACALRLLIGHHLVGSAGMMDWRRRIPEGILAVAVFLCVAVPGLMELGPWVLTAAVAVALYNSRLGMLAAAVVAAALLVAVLAWQTIDYAIPGLGSPLVFKGVTMGLIRPAAAGGMALGLAALGVAVAYALVRIRENWLGRLSGYVTWVQIGGLCAVHICGVALAMYAYRHLSTRGASRDDPWVDVQLWASRKAPPDAVFLTPPQVGGFRMHSNRAVVGEWRDGTQLYFKASFADDWWVRMAGLRPAAYDERGIELSRGISLEQRSDKEILALARQFNATHVVLPTPPPGRQRELYEVYANSRWTVYEPRIPTPDDAFLDSVARPNIEKYRMSPVKLTLTDTDGKAVTAGEFQVTQTKQAFLFGCSLPPFEDLLQRGGEKIWMPEWTAPPVTPRQLERFKEVFNFSMIPFSAKWNVIESVQGQRYYKELDQYVDWCTKNGITMEFHYLGGFTPMWARKLTAEQRKAAWIQYCRDVVARYQDRILYWQLTNDKYLFDAVPEVAREMREKYPHLKLGISDCAKFHSTFTGADAEMDMMGKWGLEEIESMQAQKAPLDYFCTHGHKPQGCWPDMRVVYQCLDRYAKYGIKVHITEMTISLAAPMLGTREGQGKWTPEAQADFFESFYTTLFSHPAVEAVNYWDLSSSVPRNFYSRGPGGGGRGIFGSRNPPASQPTVGEAGLLDPTRNDEPRLGFERLKKLIRQTWMTRQSGRLEGTEEVSFTGFHGDYEISVKTAAGKTLFGTFSVKPEVKNELALKLTER